MSEPVSRPSESPQPFGARAQVVSVRRQRRSGAQVVEVAVVMPSSSGGFTHRRVVANANERTVVLPGLFNPNPSSLIQGTGPEALPWVRDMSFGTLAEAYTAAQHQDPPADPEAWLNPEQFRWPSPSVPSARHAPVRSPLASHIHLPAGGTPMAWAIRGALAVAVYLAVTYVVLRLPYWIGLDTPETRSSALDWAMITLLLVTAAGVAVWAGVHATAVLAARARVTGHPAEVLAVPTTLRVTGRTRFLWLLGWMCGAAFCFIFAATAGEPGEGDIAFVAFFVAVGLPQVVLAVRGYPRAIIADDRGVTIHNLFRHVTIPWDELRSIDYKQVDTEGMEGAYYKLTFNGRITADVPAGQNQPGGYLDTLRDTLLRMQQRH